MQQQAYYTLDYEKKMKIFWQKLCPFNVKKISQNKIKQTHSLAQTVMELSFILLPLRLPGTMISAIYLEIRSYKNIFASLK